MRRPLLSPIGLLISSSALERATTDGLAALPRETGGILLGFRTPELIVITRSMTVPDPQSSRRSYRRRRSQAQLQMTAALHNAPPVVGYVGEWHTHPSDHPPSSMDTEALGSTASITTQPVALIVLARINDENWRRHGLVALRDGWPIPFMAAVTMWPTELAITNEKTASLESAAALVAHPAQEAP